LVYLDFVNRNAGGRVGSELASQGKVGIIFVKVTEMTTIAMILQFVLMLGLVMFVHEFGHFIASKSLGIPVEEFGFGLPPRMVKLFTWKGTEFTLNWIPFGAFVRPKGENDEGEPDGMLAAPAWKRTIILLAGATMNFILGLILLFFLFNAIGKPVTNQVLISDVVPNSPAQAAGIQKNDLVLALDGTKIDNVDNLVKLIQAKSGQNIVLELQREGQNLSVNLTPNPTIGVYLGNPTVKASPGESLRNAFQGLGQMVKELVTLPARLIRGSIDPEMARLSGFKGMFDMFSYAAEQDQELQSTGAVSAPVMRMNMVIALTIGLGVMNLMPIPGLDGGQILLLLPELLFKKKLPQKMVNTLNFMGIALLMLLLVYVNIMDFVNPIKLP